MSPTVLHYHVFWLNWRQRLRTVHSQLSSVWAFVCAWSKLYLLVIEWRLKSRKAHTVKQMRSISSWQTRNALPLLWRMPIWWEYFEKWWSLVLNDCTSATCRLGRRFRRYQGAQLMSVDDYYLRFGLRIAGNEADIPSFNAMQVQPCKISF